MAETLGASTAPYKLFTAQYRVFRPDMGLPIQISNGRPKYALAYSLNWKIPILYPEWELVKNYKKYGLQEFRRRYWAGLDAHGGPGYLHELFGQIAWRSGQENLVLMCFERDVKDCHRGDFSIYWENRTGETIPELRR